MRFLSYRPFLQNLQNKGVQKNRNIKISSIFGPLMLKLRPEANFSDNSTIEKVILSKRHV